MSDSERQGLRRRFDARLDAYLRRTLSPQDHDRISTSVKCVASLTGDVLNKHKYAILGHKCVYLADVPPKNVKVAVHLRDVQSVQMLDDLPGFLNRKDSENTVHIQVRYHMKAKEKSDIFSSIVKRSPSVFRKTKTDPLTTITLPPTPISLTPPSSPPPGSKTHPGPRSKSLSPKSPLLLSTKSSPQARPLPSFVSPKRAADIKFRSSPIHGSLNSVNIDEPSSLTAIPRSPQVPSRLTSNHRSRSTNTLFAPGPLTVQQRSSSSNNLYATSPLTESKRQHNLLSITDAMGLSTEQERTASDRSALGVMDLYILQPVSDFYHQLCVAWDNWNINQLCDTDDTQKHRSPLTQRDHFSQRYLSLKQDLLQCSPHQLEVAAGLALELSTAAQRYSVIKRLFWEDCELLDFCVHQLEAHLNLTTPLQHSMTDRMEYSVILMDMVYQMLKETYHIKKKMVTLTRNVLISLATVIISNSLNTPHPELASLEREGMEKSCGILYELLQVCLQTRWPEADKTSLVITKVVDDIIKLPGSMDFLGRMSTYMCDVIGLKSESVIEVAAKNRVSLHHTSFVLHCLLQHCSNDSMRLMKQCLGDNFRYYISVTRCKQVLTGCNPLSRKTVSFLQTVKSKII